MSDSIAFIYSKKVKKFKKNVAHIWDGSDTFCRMWKSNGMLRKERFEIADDLPTDIERDLCLICLHMYDSKNDSISRSTF
jgi:hypothetical protein